LENIMKKCLLVAMLLSFAFSVCLSSACLAKTRDRTRDTLRVLRAGQTLPTNRAELERRPVLYAKHYVRANWEEIYSDVAAKLAQCSSPFPNEASLQRDTQRAEVYVYEATTRAPRSLIRVRPGNAQHSHVEIFSADLDKLVWRQFALTVLYGVYGRPDCPIPETDYPLMPDFTPLADGPLVVTLPDVLGDSAQYTGGGTPYQPSQIQRSGGLTPANLGISTPPVRRAAPTGGPNDSVSDKPFI
jgi:hypothetical protein